MDPEELKQVGREISGSQELLTQDLQAHFPYFSELYSPTFLIRFGSENSIADIYTGLGRYFRSASAAGFFMKPDLKHLQNVLTVRKNEDYLEPCMLRAGLLSGKSLCTGNRPTWCEVRSPFFPLLKSFLDTICWAQPRAETLTAAWRRTSKYNIDYVEPCMLRPGLLANRYVQGTAQHVQVWSEKSFLSFVEKFLGYNPTTTSSLEEDQHIIQHWPRWAVYVEARPAVGQIVVCIPSLTIVKTFTREVSLGTPCW